MRAADVSGGNPGAINVVVLLHEWAGSETAYRECLELLFHHGIIEDKLWLAFKDYAKQNIDIMMTAVNEQSPELAEAIKAYSDWEGYK